MPLREQLSRREAVRKGLGGLAAALATSRLNAATTAGNATRPNILLLMDDQHRGDCLGADGNRAIRTPNLDRLAREGARFRHAYSTVPSCTPARSALLTGLSPWHHGMLGYGRGAERYENEMPRLLREAGYHGIGIGKMHWHPQRSGHGFHQTILDEEGRAETPGFVSDYRQWFRNQAPGKDPDATGIGWNDYQAAPFALPERLHPTAWTGDRAIEFLTSYRREEPFFLKVSFARPHSPYDPPERFWRMYADADLPKANVGAWAERNACRGQKLPPDTWKGDLGAEQVRRSRQGYYGNISCVDEQVGRIVDALTQRGWLANTLILYCSDHGDMSGDHYLWRKTFGYEASVRIPMLVRWGEDLLDARRGQVLDQPVELRDVLPTFLDAAGVKFDHRRFDGRTLLDPIRGKADGWRPYVDLEHDVCYEPANHWSGLTDGRIKYLFHAMTGRQQLFYLEHDPGELHDLAGDPAHAALLKQWRSRLVDHLRERGEPFVVNGDLGLRPHRMTYSPNYPGPHPR